MTREILLIVFPADHHHASGMIMMAYMYDIYSCTVKGRLLEIDDRVFDLHQLVNQMALLVTAVDLCSTSWPHGSE